MPAGERRPVLDNVAGGPKNPALVQFAGHVVVGAQDVEIAFPHRREHEIDDLLCAPRGQRFLGPRPRRHAGEGEARNEEMGADATVLGVAQFVRQRLRHDLHARLGDIVGRISGRTGDALLGAGVDDRRRRPLADHLGRESLHPVHDAPEIDVEDAA